MTTHRPWHRQSRPAGQTPPHFPPKGLGISELCRHCRPERRFVSIQFSRLALLTKSIWLCQTSLSGLSCPLRGGRTTPELFLRHGVSHSFSSQPTGFLAPDHLASPPATLDEEPLVVNVSCVGLRPVGAVARGAYSLAPASILQTAALTGLEFDQA